MKILHLLGAVRLPQKPFIEPMSGVVATALEIARIQAELGHEVTVAVAGEERWHTSWENVSLLSLKWVPWARFQYKGGVLDFRRHIPFLIHCFYREYDILHGHLYLYFRGLRGKRRIVHFNADPIYRESNIIKGSGLKSVHFSRILADTDIQIAVSQFVADQVRTGFNGKGKVYLAHNGVNLSRFLDLNEESKNEYRKKYNLPDNARVVLYAGAITKEKGVIYLAQAFRNLTQIMEDVFLLVVGDSDLWGDGLSKNPQTEYAISVKQILSSQIENGKAILVGNKPYNEMPYYYHMSDVVVVPSIWNEAFGLVALEALAAGKPVIATRTGGMADFLNDNNSLQVQPENVEELQAAMLDLLTDKALYASLTMHTKQDAQKFRWEDSVEKIMALYNQPI